MPDRIEELFAELAESAGEQQQFQIDHQLRQQEAERELYDTPEARNALKIIGGLSLLALTRGRSGGKGLPPDLLNKAYGAVGKDFRKLIPPLTGEGRSGLGRLIFGPLTKTGQSGARVNTDVAGRVPLPKIKDPVVTKRGPRGPTNIEQPPAGPPRPAPPKGTRNTGGISDAERAQLPSRGIPSTTTGKATKFYMEKVKSLKSLEDKLRIEQAKINAGEAPSKNFTKMLEEAARLRALLKSLE